eukprot:Tbor_TRINITY_DN5399_c1_g1::TRINITY_DN5399_c1_g1_i1::g.4393::m.4393
MTHAYNSIVKDGYFTPFGSLTPAQEKCKNLLNENLRDLLEIRLRERYINEITSCITANPVEENEPLFPENFSQYQFYEMFLNIIDFVDKFDFLISCLAGGVCKVYKGFEERFHWVILNVLTFSTTIIPKRPPQVLLLGTDDMREHIGIDSSSHKDYSRDNNNINDDNNNNEEQ